MVMGRLVRKRGQAGFTLIELLIVILIIGILAAVAGPLYIGYTKDAKLGEAKSLAGSVWTTLQALAQQNCGQAQAIGNTYSRAGLSATGATTPARWTVGPAAGVTLASACANGAYSFAPAASTMDVVGATGTDVATLQVKLTWDPVAKPPTVLTCTTDGTNFSPC